MAVVEKQTWKYDIRDAFYNVVTADPFFTGFTLRKNKFLPVQQNLVPYLGVYVIGEIRTPDGDANAGCVRFIHTARIGFSCVVKDPDPIALEQLADQAEQKIMNASLTDLHLLNVFKGANQNPEGAMIESINRGETLTKFGAPSTDNEYPWAELEHTLAVVFRSEWYPDIVDELNTYHVTTGVKPDDTAAEMANRNQVVAEWTFAPFRREQPRKPWLLRRDQRR